MTREETLTLIDNENYIAWSTYEKNESIFYKTGKQLKELPDFMLSQIQIIICGKIVYHWTGVKDEDLQLKM